MTTTMDRAAARRARNDALICADLARAEATYEADVVYSRRLARLRERFEADLAAALTEHRESVRPAHQAYNHAVQKAERAYAAAINH